MIKYKSEYTLNISIALQLFTANGCILHILIANGRFLRKKMGEELRTIFTDESVFSQIKEKSRNAYIKSWEDFKNYLPGHNFEECHPGKEDIISFFNHLRLGKKMATFSIWTIYSYIYIVYIYIVLVIISYICIVSIKYMHFIVIFLLLL